MKLKGFQEYNDRITNLRRMADRFDSNTSQRTEDLLRSWDDTNSRIRKSQYDFFAFLFFFFLFFLRFLKCVVYDFITIHSRPHHDHAFIQLYFVRKSAVD